MAIELNITPEDIDRLVRESIMKAGFGAAVEKAVTSALANSYGNGPVEKAISQYVGEVAALLVREKFADKVKEAVSAVVEKKVTQELIDRLVFNTTDKMISAAERY